MLHDLLPSKLQDHVRFFRLLLNYFLLVLFWRIQVEWWRNWNIASMAPECSLILLENKHYFSLYVFLHWKNAWCYSSDRSIRNSFFTQFLEVKNEDFSRFFLFGTTRWLRSLLSFFLGRKINQILTFFLHLSHGGRTRRTRIEHVSFFVKYA